MIVETCPKCGAILERGAIATYPPIHTVYCRKCGFSHEEKEKLEYKIYKPKGVDTDLNITIPVDNDNLTVSASNDFDPSSVTVSYPSSSEAFETKGNNDEHSLTGQDIIKYIVDNKAYNLPVYRMGEPFHGEEYQVNRIHITKSEYGDKIILMID